MKAQKIAKCVKCNNTFKYHLIHNGFNESAHAYCDRCGMACVLHDASSKIPRKYYFFDRHNPYKIIDNDVEKFLEQCLCGGSFRRDSLPRCPHCGVELPQFKDIFFRTVIVEDKRVDDCWKDIGSDKIDLFLKQGKENKKSIPIVCFLVLATSAGIFASNLDIILSLSFPSKVLLILSFSFIVWIFCFSPLGKWLNKYLIRSYYDIFKELKR